MRKTIVASFAVLAASLMLMTTCIARPVQEKTNIDAVEINAIMQSLSRDRSIMQAIRLIEQAETEEEFLSVFEQLGFALESNPDFAQLENLINGDSTDELTGESEWAGYLHNMNGEVYIPGIGWTSPPDDLDSGEANWAGFLRNGNGDMLIPGYGWVDEEEFSWLEDLLADAPLCDVLSFLGFLMFLASIPVYGAALIAFLLGLETLGGGLALLFMFLYIGGFFTMQLGQFLYRIWEQNNQDPTNDGIIP